MGSEHAHDISPQSLPAFGWAAGLNAAYVIIELKILPVGAERMAAGPGVFDWRVSISVKAKAATPC